jgi:prepilin-type N-terminal cleavage/methylation domain-containing protein
MLYKSKQQNKGFTLIETLVGVAVFVVISTSIYQAYVSLFNFISLNQYKIVALNLVNEQFEIIRNLSYSNVGIPGSIPSGTIPQTQNINRSGIDFVVRTTIRNIDQPYDGTIGGNPNDLSPADNKLVEVEVSCAACINFLPLTLTTTIAPKNLETASTNGALQVKVFDANGVPVSGANVSIRNYQGTTTISIDDVTNSSGVLQIVDVPPGIEAYEIYVSKAGYSSDRTYPNGAVSNPTPSKPHATVIVQQLTQISFSIDRLSSITFNSVTDNCVAIPDVDFSLKGAKQIGSSVYKFNKNLATDNSGIYSSTTMEWDYYTVTGIDSAYDIIGINPLNPISLNPNVNQNVLLIVTPKDPRTLLVTVKDNSTLLPLTDATVRLRKGVSFDKTEITGRGSINQTDWSGGLGTGFRKNLRTLLITGETRYSLATVGSILSAGITFSGKHRLNKSISFVPFVKLDCFSPIISHGPTPGVLTTLGFDSRIKLPRNFFVSSRLGITKDSGALNFRPGLLLVGTTSLGRLFGHSRSACVLFTFSIPVAGPDRSHIPANGIHDEERHPSISVGIRFSYHYKK